MDERLKATEMSCRLRPSRVNLLVLFVRVKANGAGLAALEANVRETSSQNPMISRSSP